MVLADRARAHRIVEAAHLEKRLLFEPLSVIHQMDVLEPGQRIDCFSMGCNHGTAVCEEGGDQRLHLDFEVRHVGAQPCRQLDSEPSYALLVRCRTWPLDGQVTEQGRFMEWNRG